MAPGAWLCDNAESLWEAQQHSICYFYSHHMICWAAFWLYLEEVTVWCWRCHTGQIRWRLSTCVIVLLVCTRRRVLISKWKLLYESGLRSTSCCFSFISTKGLACRIPALSQTDSAIKISTGCQNGVAWSDISSIHIQILSSILILDECC